MAVAYALASLLVSGIRLERAPPPRVPPTLETLLSGFTYICEHSIVLGAISLDLFAVLFGGATALLPVYARTSCIRPRWPRARAQAVAPFLPVRRQAFAEAGYAGDKPDSATLIAVEIVRKPPGQVSFVVHPRRWVVERFFA